MNKLILCSLLFLCSIVESEPVYSNVAMVINVNDKTIVYTFTHDEFELVQSYVFSFSQDSFNALIKIYGEDKTQLLSQLKVKINRDIYLAKKNDRIEK